MIEIAVPAPRTAVPAAASWGPLAWRQMVRDFRAGELRLLIVAVMLAVAALTAVCLLYTSDAADE